jgi:hypothetical protein
MNIGVIMLSVLPLVFYQAFEPSIFLKYKGSGRAKYE